MFRINVHDRHTVPVLAKKVGNPRADGTGAENNDSHSQCVNPPTLWLTITLSLVDRSPFVLKASSTDGRFRPKK